MTSNKTIAESTFPNIFIPLRNIRSFKFANLTIPGQKTKQNMDITILGIESSCDDTSAAVIRNRTLLSNVIASQAVHVKYGGVIPELASRAHQQNIVPVVDAALRDAGVGPDALDAIAFTRGPGLLGSLLVGVSFAKGLSIAHGVPMVEVNHLQGHILSHFLDLPDRTLPHPDFPFLCLLVSGGHTQIVRVDSPLDMEIIGTTIDDAAGEAFDKCAKVMGLPYPGGPVIDRLAKEGDPRTIRLARPRVEGYDYSFSGLKTSFLYTLRDEMAADATFLERRRADLCASLQTTIVEILLDKLVRASRDTGIRDIAIAGGVSANSGLRNAVAEQGRRRGWRTFIPEFKFTTDNAAMIAMAGYFRYREGLISPLDTAPVARIGQMEGPR
jgi:putative glycoprotease GCP